MSFCFQVIQKEIVFNHFYIFCHCCRRFWTFYPALFSPYPTFALILNYNLNPSKKYVQQKDIFCLQTLPGLALYPSTGKVKSHLRLANIWGDQGAASCLLWALKILSPILEHHSNTFSPEFSKSEGPAHKQRLQRPIIDVNKLYLYSRYETQIHLKKCRIFICNSLKVCFNLSFWGGGENIISVTSFPGWPPISGAWDHASAERTRGKPLVTSGWKSCQRKVMKGVEKEPDSLGMNPGSATY